MISKIEYKGELRTEAVHLSHSDVRELSQEILQTSQC